MIKFFRHIRKSLLDQNKMGKYFKYAFGEIILVVIGILIALQINNLNQQRLTNKVQEKYLHLLKGEALNNLNEVAYTKNRLETMNDWQKSVFGLIDSDHDTINEKYIATAFFRIFSSSYSISYENSTLYELKNSGELKNIKNDSLRKLLITLDPLVLDVKEQEESVKNMLDRIGEYALTNFSFRAVIDESESNKYFNIPKSTRSHNSLKPILKEEEFENRLINYIGTTNGLILNQYPRLERHLNEIVKVIKSEIDD